MKTDLVFTARIPRDTLDAILTAFFKNMGFIDSVTTLRFESIELDDEDVDLTAAIEEETKN